jgi:cation diffusion facilitator CzcD-associated flavoprotein CzcO
MSVVKSESDQVPETTQGRTGSRVAIIGTGFSGVGAAVALKRAGIDDFVIFERGDDVGGTWRDNTYPGCQCDVPSHLYSFSFAPNPEWSRTYSLQPEIGDYLRRTAEAGGLSGHVRFGAPVRRARWDDDARAWEVETDAGVHVAEILVMASGPLSEPKLPDAPGLDAFEGTTFHSASWNHDHDLSGERIAVIGTGASSVQFVPHIQPKASKVLVFQRTPPWVLPHPDRPIRPWERAVYRRFKVVQQLNRWNCYWLRELMIFGFAKRPRLMKLIERIGRRHLARQVRDAELRDRLTPSYTAGCKRLLLSNSWYPAVSQSNVEVVSAGLKEVRPRSVVSTDGIEYEVDTIIFGTGFHVTDNPIMGHIHGVGGRTLAEVWREGGMRAYKGTSVAGFPNLYFLAGANTGIAHTSLVVMIEGQIRYLRGALEHMERHNLDVLEVTGESLDAYNSSLQARMEPTVWNVGGCASWYQDDKGRNPTLWPDFTWRFRLATRRFDADAYRQRVRRQSAVPTAESDESAGVYARRENAPRRHLRGATATRGRRPTDHPSVAARQHRGDETAGRDLVSSADASVPPRRV